MVRGTSLRLLALHITALATCGLCTRFGISAAAQGDGPAVLPFLLQRGFVVTLPVAIDTLRGLTFILDTGTTTTIVNREVAQRLRLAGRTSAFQSFGREAAAEEVVLPDLRMGPIGRRNVVALTTDLSPLASHFGTPADGIVGMQLLRGTCFTIDYDQRTIRFDATGKWTGSARLDLSRQLPVIDALIDGTRFRLAIDTGTDGIVLFRRALPATWKLDGTHEMAANHSTGTIAVWGARSRSIAMGSGQWAGRKVHIVGDDSFESPYDGLLGPTALGLSSVHLDLAAGVMRWRR